MKTDSACYCGSSNTFNHCCEPLLSGKQSAKTAEQLMRSRYSAFCTKNADYLITSHHPSKRATNDKQELEASFNQSEWLKLTIVSASNGLSEDTEGEVEFIATYRQQDVLSNLRERSRFVKENSQWFYLDGLTQETSNSTKRQRNDPCWCGSGKKFKKCHG